MARNSIGSTIYIGDTMGDQIAAKEAGISFGFVSYGFGMCDEFQLQFKSFSELIKHFCD